MESKKVKTPYCFFAAANGYNGFRSYFGEIFNSEQFDRIFVLKGGPGTGKSSLLTKIADTFHEKGMYAEAIYCSSDPDSLDGTIIEKGTHRVAVLDGTAPHERDAVLPGCIDELINLGDSWDETNLIRQRHEILTIDKRKKAFYKKGYEYLALAGVFDSKIQAEIMAHQNANAYFTASSHLTDELRKGRGRKTRRLISSFGRYGHVSLSTLEQLAKTVLIPDGERVQKELFLTALASSLSASGCDMVICPSPFTSDRIEGIFFPAESVAFITEASDGHRTETITWEDTLPVSVHSEIRELDAHRKDLLKTAQRYFADSSVAHFELEKIYTAAMDFRKNDQVTRLLTEKIANILERP